MPATHPEYPKLESTQRLRLRIPQAPNAPQMAWAGMPYTLYADGALVEQGVLDETGYLAFDHQVITQQYRLEMANGTHYQLPVPLTYRNPEQGQLANRGLHHQTFQADSQVNQPSAHNDIRTLYASLLKGPENPEHPETVSTSEEGPGKWVTQETDYHGLQNTGQMFLNRLNSLGDEGRLFGSEGKDYENTKRTLIQQWMPLTADEEHLRERSAIHPYGEIRRIEQTFLEGDDNWQVSGKSWHWQPVTASTAYEFQGTPV